jgi:hypothetical protein
MSTVSGRLRTVKVSAALLVVALELLVGVALLAFAFGI